MLGRHELTGKWASYGAWLAQHDPDFTPDGQISVYNNNFPRGWSEIVWIDPQARAVTTPLAAGGVRFYSKRMGEHQYLPNGNVLIVVPEEGRVLELTANGDLVMEYNNLSHVGPDYSAHVENGVWLPADHFEALPGCPLPAPGAS